MNIERIESVFKENFSKRGEVGASLSIWQGETQLVSLAGGLANRKENTPWTEKTLIPVWSATKGPAAACVLHALDAINQSPDLVVADIWPEFAAVGKESVTVGEILSHQGGLSALDQEVSVFDYQAVISALENQTPAWKPGTSHGYHPRTFGFLADEIIRRLTNANSLGEYWLKTFAEPMELDFWIGLPSSEHPRVGTLYPGRMEKGKQPPFYEALGKKGTLTQRTFMSPKGLNAVAEMNQPAGWESALPAMGGVGTAEALGKFYAMLANGGRWENEMLVSHQALNWMEEMRSSGADEVLQMKTAFSAGFMKDPVDKNGQKLRTNFGPSARAFGHPGAGGSHAFADPEHGISFAYTMNQMELDVLPNQRSLGLVSGLYFD